MPRSALLLLPLAALACKPPPPAPEGLQDSLTYLFRNFYEEDAVVGAGLTGFMDWVDTDGDELLGKSADMDNVGEFSLAPLADEDVAGLPIQGSPVLADAPGTVALSELVCDWKKSERYLVRTDQDIVFGEFESYSRNFLTPRATYEDATTVEDFPPVEEALADPYTTSPDLGDLERAFLLTTNQASTTDVGVTMNFGLLLNMRHGLYDVQGEEVGAFMILTWIPERVVSEGGDSSIEQSYSLELDIARPGDKTLRLMASWIQLESILSDDMVAVAGVNKNLDSSMRLADICSGAEDLPAE